MISLWSVRLIFDFLDWETSMERCSAISIWKTRHFGPTSKIACSYMYGAHEEPMQISFDMLNAPLLYGFDFRRPGDFWEMFDHESLKIETMTWGAISYFDHRADCDEFGVIPLTGRFRVKCSVANLLTFDSTIFKDQSGGHENNFGCQRPWYKAQQSIIIAALVVFEVM